MQLVTRSAPPHLSPWVRRLWVIHAERLERPERILPSGIADVIFNLGSAICLDEGAAKRRTRVVRESFVTGVKTGHVCIRSDGAVLHVGVQFEPAGAQCFVDAPLHELSEDVIDGELVFGKSFAECHARLLECRADAARFDVLVRWLERALLTPSRASRPADEGVRLLLRSRGTVTVDDLSKRLDVSTRTLHRLFLRYVGVGPRELASILRFHRAARSLCADAAPTLADLAVASGYYDQAHMTRAFRRFSGLAPSELRRERCGPDRVPVL